LSESNIAGLGTELEKEVRLHAAETEKAWKGIGQKPGTLVWRIENFQVVAQPLADFGSFFSGDSYIILHTYKTAGVDKLFHNVHFWLGLETTQDEAGTAAYKTVELDDFLAGLPVQYREVQGYESKQFLSLFPKLVISEGGLASGFTHVEATKYETRLYQVNFSNKNLVVRQVPLSYKSLNNGDVFIVDKGLQIYQWNGC
jgi:gelsolin